MSASEKATEPRGSHQPSAGRHDPLRERTQAIIDATENGDPLRPVRYAGQAITDAFRDIVRECVGVVLGTQMQEDTPAVVMARHVRRIEAALLKQFGMEVE